MKRARCSGCGANINLKENNETYVCPYCKTTYFNENADNRSSSQTNNGTQIINNYYEMNSSINQLNENTQKAIPPKPKLNVFITIILLFCNIFFALIYIAIINNRIRDWEEEYNKR